MLQWLSDLVPPPASDNYLGLFGRVAQHQRLQCTVAGYFHPKYEQGAQLLQRNRAMLHINQSMEFVKHSWSGQRHGHCRLQ